MFVAGARIVQMWHFYFYSYLPVNLIEEVKVARFSLVLSFLITDS